MKKRLMVFDVYAHNFGLLVPNKTGIFWEQQLDGVACHHVRIEGTFLPLYKPLVMVDKNLRVKTSDSNIRLPSAIYFGGWNPEIGKFSGGKWIDLTIALQGLNYQYKHKESELVFDQIIKRLPFDCKLIDSPQEVNCAIYSTKCFKKKLYKDFKDPDWIAVKEKVYNQEGLQWIKIGNPNMNYSLDDWTINLKGKIVALIYPNCD